MPSKKRTSSNAGAGKSNKKAKAVEVAEDDGAREDFAPESVEAEQNSDCRFVGEPISDHEALQRWPHRYQKKNKACGNSVEIPKSFDDGEIMQSKNHFSQAIVDGITYNINDNAHVQADEGKLSYICKIIEMFEGVDDKPYFRAQWFYRAQDTEIQKAFNLREVKRVFISKVEDDNPLCCLVKKLHIVRVPPNVDVATKMRHIPDCDYYYDMLYLVPYSTFVRAPEEEVAPSGGSCSTISCDLDGELGPERDLSCNMNKICQSTVDQNSEMRLLDLYSGCGAMSTGICLGANIGGVKLITRWAVDLNQYACESLKINHPETEVRNETVDDFLTLLKEWEKLCVYFSLKEGNETCEGFQGFQNDEENAANDGEDDKADGEDDKTDGEDDKTDGEGSEEFEVEKVLAICYGDPKKIEKRGLYFKVSWKGYQPEDDTWEPSEGLSDCQEKVKEFVKNGYRTKMLPLPGDVDVICGGPPCQGISGFNRFRKTEKPLEDEKNQQLTVYMDVVDYLKPKFVLMENVVDLVKFSGGFLGRYALGRLVDMNFQVRMGIMAAGAYGLPQFRMRVFLMGARPTENLPPYPLPTHDIASRGFAPTAFEKVLVAYDEGHEVELKKKLCLEDAISDLPEVINSEERDEMHYTNEPQTEFQQVIRLKKDACLGLEVDSSVFTSVLYDHRPYKLNDDDFQRVSRIPKRKGANFRDLPGVIVGKNNKVEWDPNVERVYLPSKKPLVPDYAMSFVDGKSSKPFGRLWWDEIVPTVVTRAEPHNQAILHPLQDRVLTIRENARLQGFPDFYKLLGPVKERYMQVGNAVAVPVARALGYCLAKASQGEVDGGPLFTLPPNFPRIQDHSSPSVSQD